MTRLSRHRDEPRSSETSPEADPVEVARQIALRRLAVRDHTAAELRSALAARGVPEPAIDAVVDRFGEVGLVDDRRFASAWVQSRHAQRHVSRSFIARELSMKGVAPEIVTDAVAGIDRESELLEARHLAERRLRSLQGVDRQVAYRRLAGLLARRGFGSSIVNEVVRDLLDGRDLDAGDASDGDDWSTG